MLDRWYSEELHKPEKDGLAELIGLLQDRDIGLGELARRMDQGRGFTEYRKITQHWNLNCT